EVADVLLRVFAPDADGYDERPAGEAALAALVVGADGRALLDSAVLSSCAWATGQVLRKGRGGRDWLPAFEGAAAHFSAAVRALVAEERPAPQEDAPPQPISRVIEHADLHECLAAAVAAAGSGGALSGAEIRISSHIVARRKADTVSGHEVLNSLIMGD